VRGQELAVAERWRRYKRGMLVQSRSYIEGQVKYLKIIISSAMYAGSRAFPPVLDRCRHNNKGLPFTK